MIVVHCGRLIVAVLILALLAGCEGYSDHFLDLSIPRVTVEPGQIATVRTMWWNGYLQQTAFLDREDRILEEFRYGYTNEKTLYRYKAGQKLYSAYYYHNDSSSPGFVQLTERWFTYDRKGRLIEVRMRYSDLKRFAPTSSLKPSVVRYSYKSPYDTLTNQQASPNPSTVADTDSWERDNKGKLKRHYQLYSMQMPQESNPDTIYYFSQRFSHDSLGRLQMAWFDFMHLGRFYMVQGPDTTRYFYGERNRLIREIRQYTIDRRNKLEIDTTALDKFERRSVRDARRRYFLGDEYSLKNQRVDTVEYRYERFDSRKHLPLQVSREVGY